MIGLVVAFLSVLLPLVHVALSRHPRTGGRVVHLLLLYALVLDVGVIGFFFGFIPHVFFACLGPHTATSIKRGTKEIMPRTTS
jgi:hypothetical protein